jgi:hypothetical protein
MSWEAASVIVNTALVVCTIIILLANWKLVQAGQDQARASHEQVRQALEAEYDSRRPLLVPVGSLPLRVDDNRKAFDFNQAECPLTLRNVGSGVALNIRAVMHPPRPQESPAFVTSRQTLWLGTPLAAAESIETKTKVGMTIVSGDANVGSDPSYTLYAPRVPSLSETLRIATPHVVARLTVTYHDVYGRKHASVFDYTDQEMWICAGFARAIPQDIEDLDREERIADPAPPPTGVGQASSRYGSLPTD